MYSEKNHVHMLKLSLAHKRRYYYLPNIDVQNLSIKNYLCKSLTRRMLVAVLENRIPTELSLTENLDVENEYSGTWMSTRTSTTQVSTTDFRFYNLVQSNRDGLSGSMTISRRLRLIPTYHPTRRVIRNQDQFTVQISTAHLLPRA